MFTYEVTHLVLIFMLTGKGICGWEKEVEKSEFCFFPPLNWVGGAEPNKMWKVIWKLFQVAYKCNEIIQKSFK